MTSAFERKKDPEGVRRALLDSTTRLALEHGLAAVTLSAIARGAGVTKGGLFHHFPNKQSLIQAMFQELLDHFDEAIIKGMADDPVEHGRFTRAYVRAVFHDQALGEENPSSGMSVAVLADPDLQEQWSKWLGERLERHEATDGDAMCEVVRLAADGVWLASFSSEPRTPFQPARALKQMISLTYPPGFDPSKPAASA